MICLFEYNSLIYLFIWLVLECKYIYIYEEHMNKGTICMYFAGVLCENISYVYMATIFQYIWTYFMSYL